MPIVELGHEKYLKNLQKKGSVLVCPRFSGKKIFPDNLIGECNECKADIQFRPYNEIAPIKLCEECISKKNVVKRVVSEKTFEEVYESMLKRGVGG